MRTYYKSGLEQILYGDLEGQAKELPRNAPSSATLLVSLFLILITFFVVLNNHAKPDAAKRKAVLDRNLAHLQKIFRHLAVPCSHALRNSR